MEFKAYHKIRQFKDIQFKANFKGLDSDDQPIYKESKKPTLTFKGTVKLHGTNAGICYTPEEGIIAQKRSSLLKPENLGNTHFEFNNFVQVIRKKELTTLMTELYNQYCNKNEQITLYGEWAGKGVQKSVGISQHKKSFYIFDCKVYNKKTEEFRWVDISTLEIDIESVYNIHSFSVYNVDIDFNTPAAIQNKLIEFTNQVELECPVAKQLGYEKNFR